MKIAILGTKGIPNHYGGFEQFAEFLSIGLVQRGHEVTVYSPHFHAYQQHEYQGVRLIHKYCPEKTLGGAAHFIYDHLCLSDAIDNHQFDIIYEAGYASCAPSLVYYHKKKKRSLILTNMDGLEWKRSKWSRLTQSITRYTEKLAVRNSDVIISDNVGIQNYFLKTYGVQSFYLPYGADLTSDHSEDKLAKFNLVADGYLLVIARLEPENNIEEIINGYLQSEIPQPLVIIGGLKTKHAQTLLTYRANKNVIFLGSIYDKQILDSLRYYSKAYLHGHSVGGTNPSLLEAMADQSFILAHNNEFNKSVLVGNAIFFNNRTDLREVLKNLDTLRSEHLDLFRKNNIARINGEYSWPDIIDRHERLFVDLVSNRTQSFTNI